MTTDISKQQQEYKGAFHQRDLKITEFEKKYASVRVKQSRKSKRHSDPLFWSNCEIMIYSLPYSLTEG